MTALARAAAVARRAGRLRRRTTDVERPRLKPLPAGAWMAVVTVIAAGVIWVTTAWLLQIAGKAEAGTDRARIRVDAVRTGLAAGAGAGAAVTLMLAFRRQRHQEIATAWSDHDAAERRITDLYTKAADQLGSDKAPVRLAGLYALERLANDNPAHRQTIVNLLCAYLRMPYTPPPAADTGDRQADRHQLRYQAARRGAQLAPDPPPPPGPDPHEERQVRLTAQRLLATHLRTGGPAPYWGTPTLIDLDLTGATLLDFDLTNCTLGDADFQGASFSGRAVFWDVSFSGRASFLGASFSGTAAFWGASFSGRAVFGRASFSGADFQGASFSGADFQGASFSGRAVFGRASFSGAADFLSASFSGRADFRVVTFSGRADFRGAVFSGRAVFGRASFSGRADFRGAVFSEDVGLADATVADHGRERVWPPGWAVEPAGDGTGRLVRAAPPAPDGAGEEPGETG